jgi:hypothetical protein
MSCEAHPPCGWPTAVPSAVTVWPSKRSLGVRWKCRFVCSACSNDGRESAAPTRAALRVLSSDCIACVVLHDACKGVGMHAYWHTGIGSSVPLGRHGSLACNMSSLPEVLGICSGGILFTARSAWKFVAYGVHANYEPFAFACVFTVAGTCCCATSRVIWRCKASAASPSIQTQPPASPS